MEWGYIFTGAGVLVTILGLHGGFYKWMSSKFGAVYNDMDANRRDFQGAITRLEADSTKGLREITRALSDFRVHVSEGYVSKSDFASALQGLERRFDRLDGEIKGLREDLRQSRQGGE